MTLYNGGFTYQDGFKTLFIAGFVMFFLDTIVEPVLNLILLPINFLTRGLFGWLVGLGLFYALTFFVPAISISEWTFQGYTLPNIIPQIPVLSIPAFTFQFWQNLVLLAFSYNFISSLIKWIFTE
jgi:uncharacterized membrane protein YvlD (DUF360 family)